MDAMSGDEGAELAAGPVHGEADEAIGAEFDSLFARVTSASGGFAHREHLHLTWLAVREPGLERADALVEEGLHRVARYAQRPEKFNATMSRAWILLIAHHIDENIHSADSTRGRPSTREEGPAGREEGDADHECDAPDHEGDAPGNDGTSDGSRAFAAFLERNPALLDKRLLLRFYRSSTLASPAARSSWLEPDLVPLPVSAWSRSHGAPCSSRFVD